MKKTTTKKKAIEFLLEDPMLKQRIVKDYSGTNLHKTHNDEYYTSRVYEF